MMKQAKNRIFVRIGGLGIELYSLRTEQRVRLEPAYQQFIDTAGEVDMRLYFQSGMFSLPNERKLLFDSGCVWELWESAGKRVFTAHDPEYGPQPYKTLVLDPEGSHAEFYAADPIADNPLEFPLDELLLIHLLGQGRGIMLHCCGIDAQGQGLVFIGKSGIGKSTMARLWQQTGSATVLNDDRIIVRDRDDQFALYGTPWHGDVTQVSAGSVPLHKLFFLRQATTNSLRKLSCLETVSRLIVASFAPLWDKPAMEFTLAFCEQIARTVVAYELDFVPDESVLDCIREVL
jgi:hypothetical protein